MTHPSREKLTEAELQSLFDRLFPYGVHGSDVLAEIAPDGWHRSPLLSCFHPSEEQLHREAEQIRRNIDGLVARRRRKAEKAAAPPEREAAFEQGRAAWKETPIDVFAEASELVGRCLWDIFSDNHEVIAPNGRVADIGSFRAAAGFIDAWMTGRAGGATGGDYLRFYLGSIWVRGRANLIPVYQMIFRRLQSLGADWEYRFPELHLVDLSGDADSEEPDDDEEPEERRREVEDFRATLAEINRAACQDARLGPPPEVVRAYEIVYGRTPRGWPPGIC